MLLAQFLVLAFTCAVWWLARRDLASRPAQPATQHDAQEMEQLCVTLASLVTDLSGRMEAVEQKLQQNVGATLSPAAPPSSPAVLPPAPMPTLDGSPAPPMPSELPMPPATAGLGVAGRDPARPLFPALSQEAPAAEAEIAAHAPLYALLDAGITDPAEITRRTGLGRGEVDLILSLRARRAR